MGSAGAGFALAGFGVETIAGRTFVAAGSDEVSLAGSVAGRAEGYDEPVAVATLLADSDMNEPPIFLAKI